MPKFRCHLPKKEGDEKEAKKTEDGWDATFVFDGPTAPKGMVCKDITPKAKPSPKETAGVELPKAVTLPVAETVTEQPKAVSDTVPAEAETTAVVEVPAGRPDDFTSPASPQPVSNPSGGAAEFAALAVATAVAGALLASTFAKPSASKATAQSKQGHKGRQGKQTSRQEQKARLDQQRQKREEKERKDCGASTEAVRADAQKDEQKFEAVLARINSLLRRLGDLEEEAPTSDLADSIDTLSRRIARLEARQQVSSKRDNEPRTARRRRQKPAPQEKPAAEKAPRPRRT